MQNLTLVVLTDRIDLNGQFLASSNAVRKSSARPSAGERARAFARAAEPGERRR